MSEKSMRDRMAAGESYRPDDPELDADMRRARSRSFRINQTDPADVETLRELFTELLGAYGEDADIRPPFQCDYGHHTRFGARSFANFGLVVLDVAPVTVGDDGAASNEPSAAPATAAPTAEQTVSPEVTTAAEPDSAASNGGTAWIWALVIVGVVVVAGVVVWIIVSRRQSGPSSDSDSPSER